MPRIILEVPVSEDALRRLRALPDVALHVFEPHQDWLVPPELLDVAILLCKIPPANLDDLKALAFIQLSTVGYEHLKPFHLADRPLRVANARGIFDSAIAEWVLAMMINLVRDVRGMIRNQDLAHWDRDGRYQQEVRGKVVGLWGYGGIGRETARLCRAFGMYVRVLTRHVVGPRRDAFTPAGTGDPDGTLPEQRFLVGQDKEFLGGLDFLVLALPHTKESDGMVGEAELRALPPSAFLLNPARGPIVREAALVRALHEGWIAGAALDTHFAYPLPAEHPLWRMPNVILTPHISGADRSAAFPARMGELFCENVERYRAGRPLLNELTQREWREA
jgi:phosphoglycerate dehydrogenase-like enzyme